MAGRSSYALHLQRRETLHPPAGRSLWIPRLRLHRHHRPSLRETHAHRDRGASHRAHAHARNLSSLYPDPEDRGRARLERVPHGAPAWIRADEELRFESSLGPYPGPRHQSVHSSRRRCRRSRAFDPGARRTGDRRSSRLHTQSRETDLPPLGPPRGARLGARRVGSRERALYVRRSAEKQAPEDRDERPPPPSADRILEDRLRVRAPPRSDSGRDPQAGAQLSVLQRRKEIP